MQTAPMSLCLMRLLKPYCAARLLTSGDLTFMYPVTGGEFTLFVPDEDLRVSVSLASKKG